PEVLEPERLRGRGDDEAVRARIALLAQDHAPERHPHLRLPVHPGQLRHLDGVFPLAHTRAGDRQRTADRNEEGRALGHRHVHRDLKPANVLINNEGLLKIVDFGVAAAHREGDTQLTKTGYVIGSPKYMAPEQILGRKVDERADIYAIGVILYEMFTGVPPYAR